MELLLLLMYLADALAASVAAGRAAVADTDRVVTRFS